jgi:DMSO reductase family type II enzyme chaperone
MVQDQINTWAVFHFMLGYPDERRWAALTGLLEDVPPTLEELRAHYIELFEAGMPRPKCPLLESYYVLNRPPGDILLENKLFYQHFGMSLESGAAPDHLLTQLEFLAWLDHAISSGNADAVSFELARRDFIERHLAHWLPTAAHRLEERGGRCYTEVMNSLCDRLAEMGHGTAPACAAIRSISS